MKIGEIIFFALIISTALISCVLIFKPQVSAVDEVNNDRPWHQEWTAKLLRFDYHGEDRPFAFEFKKDSEEPTKLKPKLDAKKPLVFFGYDRANRCNWARFGYIDPENHSKSTCLLIVGENAFIEPLSPGETPYAAKYTCDGRSMYVIYTSEIKCPLLDAPKLLSHIDKHENPVRN